LISHYCVLQVFVNITEDISQKMAKKKTIFACTNCGAQSPKWAGRCVQCGQWNTMQEDFAVQESAGFAHVSLANSPPVALQEIPDAGFDRVPSGIGELDRVLGGGIVAGMTILVGGEPGIGKSTLMLQAANRIASAGRRVLYVTGEESLGQTKMRAARLGADSEEIYVLAENSLETIIGCIENLSPDLLVIDSVQMVHRRDIHSAPGTVAQVRQCSVELICLAKRRGCGLFLVGHITKEGSIAGPKVLEHLVDCVLYFEGDRFHAYRMLRTIKNRYGSTNEIGVFEMTESGLKDVLNPSIIFLSERDETQAGSAIAATIEGSRPLLVEVQALASRSAFSSPTRRVAGVDASRVAMVLAIIDRHTSFQPSGSDIFVNIVGGIQVGEPAGDLSIAMAIASSLSQKPVPADCVFAAELGLGGELRAVSMAQRRLKEAEKLGFKQIVLAPSSAEALAGRSSIGIRPFRTIAQVLNVFC